MNVRGDFLPIFPPFSQVDPLKENAHFFVLFGGCGRFWSFIIGSPLDSSVFQTVSAFSYWFLVAGFCGLGHNYIKAFCIKLSFSFLGLFILFRPSHLPRLVVSRIFLIFHCFLNCSPVWFLVSKHASLQNWRTIVASFAGGPGVTGPANWPIKSAAKTGQGKVIRIIDSFTH